MIAHVITNVMTMQKQGLFDPLLTAKTDEEEMHFTIIAKLIDLTRRKNIVVTHVFIVKKRGVETRGLVANTFLCWLQIKDEEEMHITIIAMFMLSIFFQE